MEPGLQTLPKLSGFYVRNIAANLIGSLIIALLNISSPLQFLEDWVAYLLKGGWVLIFILIVIACTIITILQYFIQYPIYLLMKNSETACPLKTIFRSWCQGH